METINSDDAVVEAIISLWSITNKGQLQKDKEVQFEYDMKFRPTTNGDMMLRLSNDKRIVTLSMQDPENDNRINLYAWSTRNLHPHPISENL